VDLTNGRRPTSLLVPRVATVASISLFLPGFWGLKDWVFLAPGNLSRFVSPCEVSEVGWSQDFRVGGRESSASDSDLGTLVLDSWLLGRSFRSVLAEIEGKELRFGCKFSVKISGGIQISVICGCAVGFASKICCLRRPR